MLATADFANALDGRQSKPDRGPLPGGCECHLALVDVRRQHRDIHNPSLVDKDADLVGVAPCRW